MQEIDIQSWNRNKTFNFFRNFEKPLFNICANVDITEFRQFVRQNKLSFFAASIYLSTRTANKIKAFRLRIRDNKVIEHDILNAGSTILNEDETFSFCYFKFDNNFENFANEVKLQTDALKNKGVSLSEPPGDDNLIHYSVIPWISFTSFSHARRDSSNSVPRIVFGKYFESAGKLLMPVSVEVHHSLADGLDVGKFFQLFQKKLNTPEMFLK